MRYMRSDIPTPFKISLTLLFHQVFTCNAVQIPALTLTRHHLLHLFLSLNPTRNVGAETSTSSCPLNFFNAVSLLRYYFLLFLHRYRSLAKCRRLRLFPNVDSGVPLLPKLVILARLERSAVPVSQWPGLAAEVEADCAGYPPPCQSCTVSGFQPQSRTGTDVCRSEA